MASFTNAFRGGGRVQTSLASTIASLEERYSGAGSKRHLESRAAASSRRLAKRQRRVVEEDGKDTGAGVGENDPDSDFCEDI